MNAEQAKKHKEVIQWWINHPNQGVWCKSSGQWIITYSPMFSYNEPYLPNDKYSELRKAHYDGKIIQSQIDSASSYSISWGDEVEWHDECEKNLWRISAEGYRIKPENRFKIGDWVTVEEFNFPDMVSEITTCGIKLLIHDCNYVSGSDEHEVKLWEPKQGEWCVFWDKYTDKKEYLIFKYSHKQANHYYPLNKSNHYYEYIAPLEFMQTLEKSNETNNIN